MNITEDYVSFEVAKLLKEKGFDENTNCYYIEGSVDKNLYYSPIRNNHNKRITNNEFDINIDIDSSRISAPTLQMAMKWLRQQGIYITIMYGDYPALKKIVWTPQIDSLTGFDIPDEFYQDYSTYEEACEAAIKYCLTNLI